MSKTGDFSRKSKTKESLLLTRLRFFQKINLDFELRLMIRIKILYVLFRSFGQNIGIHVWPKIFQLFATRKRKREKRRTTRERM